MPVFLMPFTVALLLRATRIEEHGKVPQFLQQATNTRENNPQIVQRERRIWPLNHATLWKDIATQK
jgi:hypothetical protein